MQIVTNVALISINETLLVQLISFLIFLFVINRIMFRPLRRTMAEREHYVDRIQRDIHETKDQIEHMLKQSRKEEAEARSAGAVLSAEAQAAGQEEASRLIHRARDQIEAMRHEAQTDMEAKLTEQRVHIEREAQRIALRLMEKLLDRKVAS